MNNIVYLLLGSNLGDSEKYIEEAKKSINGTIGLIKQTSSLYKTAAWGNTNQPDFMNQVVVVSSTFSPQGVLKKIIEIEAQLDRIRIEKWAARTIDIDILFYNEQCIDEANLIIPHPYLHQRNFTLAPLMEIASDFIHPIFNKTIAELYETLSDGLSVQRIDFHLSQRNLF